MSIAERAYCYYANDGRPNSLDNWLLAEKVDKFLQRHIKHIKLHNWTCSICSSCSYHTYRTKPFCDECLVLQTSEPEPEPVRAQDSVPEPVALQLPKKKVRFGQIKTVNVCFNATSSTTNSWLKCPMSVS